MYGGIHERGRCALPTMYAHLSHVLHWRLANAQPDLPQLYGASWRCPTDQLRNQLATWIIHSSIHFDYSSYYQIYGFISFFIEYDIFVDKTKTDDDDACVV